MKLQEDINKLVEWANKWQMNFDIDKCSVMHIGHNNRQSNHYMSNRQLPTTDQQRDLGIIITHQRPQVAKTNREKLQNGQQSNGVHWQQFQVLIRITATEIRNHSYYHRIQDVDIISLVQRIQRGQLIEVFKYLNRFTTASVRVLFDYDLNGRTRNNGAKLIVKHFNTSVAQHFYPEL